MINLLPYKEKKSIERVRWIRMARTVSGGLLAIIIVAFVLLLPTLMTINSRFAIANNQIKSLEKEGAIATDVDIVGLENRAKIVGSKLSTKPGISPTDYVQTIKQLIPTGITVDRFAYEQGQIVEVSGITQSREILQSFIKTLESDPTVSLVDSPVSNFIKNTNSPFKIAVSFK